MLKELTIEDVTVDYWEGLHTLISCIIDNLFGLKHAINNDDKDCIEKGLKKIAQVAEKLMLSALEGLDESEYFDILRNLNNDLGSLGNSKYWYELKAQYINANTRRAQLEELYEENDTLRKKLNNILDEMEDE